jgi:hypothetical protein
MESNMKTVLLTELRIPTAKGSHLAGLGRGAPLRNPGENWRLVGRQWKWKAKSKNVGFRFRLSPFNFLFPSAAQCFGTNLLCLVSI